MRSMGLASLVVLSAVLLNPVKTASALPLGDCASETGLPERTDIVFCEPRENPNWFQKGSIDSIKVTNPSAATPNDVR